MGDFVWMAKMSVRSRSKPLRPDVVAVFRAHQLSRHSHPRARFSHASFQKKLHTEFLTDLLHVPRLAFVGERRVASDNETGWKSWTGQ